MHCLEKVYADVIAEDQTVCVGYWSASKLFGKMVHRGMIELYQADGRHQTIQARPAPMPQSILTDDAQPLKLRIHEGTITWRFDVEHGSLVPTPIRPWLEWSVEFARADVTVEWPGESGLPPLRGSGYADRVRITRIPRALGLSRLRWGRIHLTDETFVFVDVRFQTGRASRQLLGWSTTHVDPVVLPLEIKELAEGIRIAVPSTTLDLSPVRVLHTGSTINRARFPSLPHRMALRLAMGSTHETRWLAAATRAGGRPHEAGWAIMEDVQFGSQPARGQSDQAGIR